MQSSMVRNTSSVRLGFSDIVDRGGKMTGKEFIQKCQLLEDVETSMYHNRKENASSNIKYRYTKEDLLKLRTHPLSSKPPSLQENLKFLLGTSKPKEREEIDLKKNLVKKHGLTRNLDGVVNEKFDLKKDNLRNGEKPIISRNEGIDETRKSADPKERIRKEQDICLSPQRKSFTTGCYVANVKSENAANNSNTSNTKTNNENTGRENRGNHETRDIRENRDNRDNKNIREGSRRIGSGRIVSRDPRFEIRGYPESDYQSSYYGGKESYYGNKEPYYGGKEKVSTIVYTRQFSSNFDKEKGSKILDRPGMNNYYGKRRSHDNRDYDEEEEPEWMKEGPVSLNDTIELKGFDETEEKSFRFNRNSRINTRVFHKSFTNNSNNRSPTAANKGRMDKRNSDSDNSSVASDSLASKLDENNSPGKSNNDDADRQKTEENTLKKEENDVKNDENSMQFNLEEILKLDPLPDISENADNESAGSKFTKWFKNNDAASSSVNGDQNLNMARNGSIPPSSLPGEFLRTQNVAGINTRTPNSHPSGPNLLELLRGSQDNNANTKVNMRALEATGKLHSVEEIEAKLRGTENNAFSNPNSPNDKKKKEEETEAFKKLLSQAFHFDKSNNDGSSPDAVFSQKPERNENTDGNIELTSVMCNGEIQANAQPQMSRLPPQMNNMQQSAEKLKFLQMQQNKQQQEILSKVLMSSPSSTTFSVPPPSNVRPSNGASGNTSFHHLAPEIQIMINSIQPTRELMQRPETVNILRALKSGEVSQYQLIEQLKKLTPYQAKFRESLLCVLKLIQSQTQYYNSAPVLGSPAGIPFNVVPPPLPAAQPYTENILQQMMLNSQFRVNGPHNGMSNIVYQRDFPSPSQNMFQNNTIKKHLVEQSPNIGQNVPRMNSPTTILSSPANASVCGSNVSNATNSMASSQDDANNAVIANKTTSSTQSLSFTPTSVLRKLSAEKENLDTFSKEAKESKGEKNTLIPYTSNTNNSSTMSSNQGTIDRYNGFGTCIPPPAISGQYFVGNMIRPANTSTQVPMFGNPPPPVLSRLPVPSNSSAVPRDANISLVGFGNQTLSSRNVPVNGTLSSAEEQMARWFSSDSVNQSRYVMAQSMGVPGASLQNMMSVEEIERVQQSVRN
ncbi:probable serine/threonine-protein kinase DDB_G0282963 isoform X2 [Planococcus citri]|uniref:probable serine/threonine-protein kinase DDB_G0282963 isoform X2 n=1 Tax=Planococcus citri TaxID=170843 RepID=UPI0031F80A11